MYIKTIWLQKVIKNLITPLTLCAIMTATLFYSANAVAGDIKGKITASRIRYVENTVLYIGKISGKEFSPPEKHAVVDQKNMKFIPHVLPILIGTTVDFLNSDALKHNVFTPDKIAEKFNLGTWPKGDIRSYTFKKPGNAVMLCNVHPEMEGWVIVLETPYYAVCDKEGNFTIENLPPGDYTLKVWNKKLKSDDLKITVPEEGDVTVEINLKR